MKNTCPNCNHAGIGNFCPECGQRKYRRIDTAYIWEEVQYLVFQTNRGFFFSIKKILQSPGDTARDFIEGRRVNHYQPIALTFILGGLSSLISFKVIDVESILNNYYEEQQISSPFLRDFVANLSSYNPIISLLLVPFFALCTYLAFRKWKNNYVEHLIINSYILSFYTLISILIAYPIMFVFRNNSDTIIQVSMLPVLLIPVILLWFFIRFYREKSFKAVVPKVALTVLYTFVGLNVMLLLFIAGVSIFASNNPQLLEYFNTQ